MTVHANDSNYNRFVEAIAAGAATVEFPVSSEYNRHQITVKVLASTGAEDAPTGGTATLQHKVDANDGYQTFIGATWAAQAMNLQTGPNTYVFTGSIVAIKVIGGTLSTNTSMVVTWRGWRE